VYVFLIPVMGFFLGRLLALSGDYCTVQLSPRFIHHALLFRQLLLQL
jgi:hypothetical protein